MGSHHQEIKFSSGKTRRQISLTEVELSLLVYFLSRIYSTVGFQINFANASYLRRPPAEILLRTSG